VLSAFSLLNRTAEGEAQPGARLAWSGSEEKQGHESTLAKIRKGIPLLATSVQNHGTQG